MMAKCMELFTLDLANKLDLKAQERGSSSIEVTYIMIDTILHLITMSDTTLNLLCTETGCGSCLEAL